MLKNIDPLLGPELIATLRQMGHGDEIAIVDANFPATSTSEPVIRLDGNAATRALEAILSVLPLDDFVDYAAFSMQVVDHPEAVPDIVAEFQEIVHQSEGSQFQIQPLERFSFYERTKDAVAIVVTGEQRLYGNILLKKGIIRPK